MTAEDMLMEWAVHSLRARGVDAQEPHDIEERTEGFDLVVRRPNGDQHCLIRPVLDIAELLDRAEGRRVLVITANTRKNLEMLLTHWNKLTPLAGLTIMFVNPTATGDQRWAVVPAVHDRITERASLRRGLEALFSGVDEWTS